MVDNQVVHEGDLLVQIDDGDYQNAVDAAKAKIATQDATIARIGRQIEAQGALIAQSEAQAEAAQAQLRGDQADVERAALEFERSQKLAEAEFRLAAAPRAGDRRPRPHRRDAGLPAGRRRRAAEAAQKGAKSQSRRAQGRSRRGGAHRAANS